MTATKKTGVKTSLVFYSYYNTKSVSLFVLNICIQDCTILDVECVRIYVHLRKEKVYISIIKLKRSRY